MFWFGPIPSECPTCAATFAESDVQSEHVIPAISVPSPFDPVRMSCSTGLGEPVHWPLMRCPRSSRNRAASPVRECNSATLFATSCRLALYHGPAPMRSFAWVGWFHPLPHGQFPLQETQGRTGRGGRRVLVTACGQQNHDQKNNGSHRLSPKFHRSHPRNVVALTTSPGAAAPRVPSSFETSGAGAQRVPAADVEEL